jgi:hypothetical protein
MMGVRAKQWLNDLTREDAEEALRVAATVRQKISLLSRMVDDKPGRNVRFEVQTDISRIASTIGDGEPTGRVLFALAWELEPDFIDPYTRMPEAETSRRRAQWFERLSGLGVAHPDAPASVAASPDTSEEP